MNGWKLPTKFWRSQIVAGLLIRDWMCGSLVTML